MEEGDVHRDRNRLDVGDVRDLRTSYETGNPQAVFDGDIDAFLEAGIRWRRGADQN